MAGKYITIEQASKLTATFRSTYPNLSKAVFYSADLFLGVMAQDNCVGLRIYNGIDDSGELTNVIVGIDSNGNDLVEGKIFDSGLICPPNCSAENALNS